MAKIGEYWLAMLPILLGSYTSSCGDERTSTSLPACVQPVRKASHASWP